MIEITGYTMNEINKIGWNNILFNTHSISKFIGIIDKDKEYEIISKNGVRKIISMNTSIINTEDEEKNTLALVKDTGIGISKDKQKMIFERFVQVDKSLTRNSEGSGIGLSLVKSLVEMHKGTITVKSELNKGSEFIITLPSYLVEEKNNTVYSNNHFIQENLEKINIEFSDIYYY